MRGTFGSPKARALLSAIGKFPDVQGAFSLLRSCLGWSNVLYSCRTVPPDAQQNGLRTVDSDLRAAMGQLIGRRLSGDDWRLASLGSPQVSSEPGVLQNNSGRLSTPLTSTRVATLCRPKMPCAVLSPLGPTFLPKVTSHPRSPCPE